MGKKPKSAKGAMKAQSRKVDVSQLPPPPKPVDEEHGSDKLLDEPSLPGTGYKALDRDGYDDGGVADLTLVIDLEDCVLRRKRGENDYFSALKADLLPRVVKGPMAHSSRREQKIKLAKLLFAEESSSNENNIYGAGNAGSGAANVVANQNEIWSDRGIGSGGDDDGVDAATKRERADRLAVARMSLSLSSVLRETACVSLALAEICKSRLSCFGRAGGEDALRCADKAIEVAGSGFWDRDDVELEAEENPKIDPNRERNATVPGLMHEESLKYQSSRAAILCLRCAYLHRGNALSALGREKDARESYQRVIPLLEKEAHCGRLDWERISVIINVGNTHCREGNYDDADEEYKKAEKLGQAHIDAKEGSDIEGIGMVLVSKRARAFALQKVGREEEGKEELKKVLEMQTKLTALIEKKRLEDEAEAKAKAELEEFARKQAMAAAAESNSGSSGVLRNTAVL